MKLTIKCMAGAGMLAMLVLPAIAAAQFSQSYNFLKAVRERDGNKATEIISKPGSTTIDTRDESTSETALIIVTRARDLQWMGFLLARGARPDLKDRQGNSALMIAAQLGFVEGAQTLLDRRATVDLTNNSGETPLIRATQQRHAGMVQLLLNAGANPRKADTIAGLSARDYAMRDSRAVNVLKLIEAAKPAKPVAISGPK